MIKIDYTNIPQEYLDYIDHFKDKIQKWHQAGSMGKGKTKIELCPECKRIFLYLMEGDNLKKLLLLPAKDLPRLINIVETKFPQLKDDRLSNNRTKSVLYQCLEKAFDLLGYSERVFPGFELTQALGLKACPYCNAEEIIIQDLYDTHIRNSELDHFYSRKFYPYLAISLYNLVPSGGICNGANFKHEKDALREGLINPFGLRDSEGFRFELEINSGGILSYSTFIDSCSIRTHVINTDLTNNAGIFQIAQRYSQELKQARKVWKLYKKISAEGYRNMLERESRLLNTSFTFETWFESELDITPNNYSNQKLSKLSMDIWRQLEEMR